MKCAATSRQDVVLRHDVDNSSEQKRRRQWDDQDVSHVLNVLDNAELSSSCSASQTSCSGSVSQTSCVTDDAFDGPAAMPHSPDLQVTHSDTVLQLPQSTGLPAAPCESLFICTLEIALLTYLLTYCIILITLV